MASAGPLFLQGSSCITCRSSLSHRPLSGEGLGCNMASRLHSCVGFLEEVIFRGLLFRAMEKDNLKTAIIVSSLTFGIGHIVNLFNGSGKDPASNVIQIVFAVLVGFVLVLIFYYGKSLIPCILFHSANNALKVFEADGGFSPQIEMVMNLVLIFVVLGGYVFYLVKVFPGKAERSKH